MTGSVTLFLGGARSGKSRLAEDYCKRSGLRKIYIATGEALDGEMAARVATHQARRGSDWLTVEEPRDLVASLNTYAKPENIVLVDCLTLWLTNVLLADNSDPEAETEALARALPVAGPVVFVANETGLGIVPETKLGRRFRDLAGSLNQQIAAVADSVTFVAAGLPLRLK